MPKPAQPPPADPRSDAALARLVFPLFFFSGATALIYQIAWARRLTLVFGASHEAVGIVLAAFMGGLALGGFVFGRWSERIRRPLLVYGLLEAAIGLLALALPWLLRLVDDVYVDAARAVDGVPWTLQVMRAGLAFAVLLLPTFLMGGTLPVLARLVIASPTRFGTRLSQLYGINTAGAVAGAAGAGFALLPALGVTSTELVAVGANLLIGVIAWRADRGLAALDVGAEGAEARGRATGTAAPAAEDASTPLATLALRLTFLGAAISGLCALALEVLWMRSLSIAVGTTTYSFTVMLCAFLVGIALGSWLHAAVPLRRVGIAAQFGAVLVGIGLSSVVVTQLVPRVPRLVVQLRAAIDPGGGGLHVGATLLACFAIMLVPCVLMGVAFPLAGEARARLRERFGQSVGDVVGLNTLGAIVGSVVAGFLLIPWIGLQRGLLLVAGLDLAYGLVVLGLALASRSTSPARRLALPVTALLALAALALPFLLPAWDVRVLATFRNNTRELTGVAEVDWERAAGGADVLYYAEGRGSNVSVIESGGTRAILIDGKSVASDSLTDVQHELLLGHLPVLLHPQPRRAAVIGLGAGITLGGVLSHPSIESVVLVEIEPAVVDGARQFAHVNGGAVDDPRLSIVFQDGRNHLRTTTQSFDVITADPIHPWAHGASYLYTAEYYAIAKERLSPGGLMCQWLPLYELSPENVAAVIATFADAFDHATVWQTAYDAVLIGSDAPLAVEATDLAERIAVPSVARQLAQIGLDDPLSFLAELALDADGIARFAEGAPRNTDDNLYLEFSSPLSIGTPQVVDNIRAIDAGRASLRAVLGDPAPLLDPDRDVDEQLADLAWAKSATVEAQIALRGARRGNADAYGPILERIEEILERVPGYGRARGQLCLGWMQRGMRLAEEGRDQEAVDALLAAVRVLPDHAEANHQLGMVLQRLGQADRALLHFAAATRERPRFARAHAGQGAALLALQRYEEARERLLQALELRPHFPEATHHLALALLRTGRTDEAGRRFEEALALAPALPGLHHNFAVLRAEQGRHAEAIALLEEGHALDEQDVRVQLQLAWLLATAPDDALRDGERAEELAAAVNRATGGSVPQALDTLAAALAETGRLRDAAPLADRAADLAFAQGQDDLGEQIRARATHYREGRPFRSRARAP